MAKVKAMGTGRIPLAFAAAVSEAANASFADGRGPMMEAVTPVTRDLLKFWFTEPFTARALNFHAGQRQAILNVVYLHEVVRAGSPRAAYAAVAEELLAEGGGAVAAELAKPKYAYPKHLVKMATGTGKTWVMHALLVWQYLNAKFETGEWSGRWTKNFLFVAPGLIVYERLLDAFCGRRVADGAGEARDFATSDLKAAESLFVPPEYRDAVFSFVQNGVVRKEDFGRKVTGDGVLAVMNWHGFLGDDEAADGERESADEGEGAGGEDGAAEADDPDGRRILDDLLPAKPGLAAGNALEALDAQYLRGGRLDFLKDLPDLMLVNDEAHHVHGGAASEEDAAKWQRGIDLLAEGKASFFQLDFSATPYEPTGSGRNAREDFFPHVVVDYDLKDAIRDGRVKTIVIDRRKDLDSLADLDYGAVREGKRIVGLSEGQRVMLRAGLKKLAYLEGEFARFDPARRPKMMVVCEETAVTPFVEEFLRGEGLFGEPFDPFAGNDWKILLCLNGHVTQHVVRQVGELVWAIETGTVKTAAAVRKVWFSSVPRIVVREGASLALRKTVYVRTGYPSHGGGLEREFLAFVDRDAQVERFVKISEARHPFARIAYLRSDGLVGEYVPDFLVATAEGVWVVETKAADRTDDANVRQKRTAALEWCRQVNALAPDDRMGRTWRYLLVSEADFYAYRDAGGTFADLCAFAEVTGAGLRGEFDFGEA